MMNFEVQFEVQSLGDEKYLGVRAFFYTVPNIEGKWNPHKQNTKSFVYNLNKALHGCQIDLRN